MKKSKFTEEQIAFALKQADTGTKVTEICRQLGSSAATFTLGEKILKPAHRRELAWTNMR